MAAAEKKSKQAVIAEASDRLDQAKCRLLTRDPWYGAFLMNWEYRPSNMDWIEDETMRTMGVYFDATGKVVCLYNPEFCNQFSVEELYGIIQHEVEHIVRLHPARRGMREPRAWNIVCDMQVNGRRNAQRVGYKESTTQPPKPLLDGNCIYLPDDWPDDEGTEDYYDRLPKN